MLTLDNDDNGNDTDKISNEGLKKTSECFVSFPSELVPAPGEVEILRASILQMKESRREANCMSKSRSWW